MWPLRRDSGGACHAVQITSDLNRIPEIVGNVILFHTFDEFDQKSKDISFVLCHRRSLKWILPADVAKLADLAMTSDMNMIHEIVANNTKNSRFGQNDRLE